jgi:signal transduction histidine kinase
MAERRPDGRVLIVARDLTQIVHVRDTIIRALLVGGALCLAGGIVVGLVLSVRQVRRVRDIRRATLRISQGHLHQRLPVGGRDEIDLLAHLVNHMLDEVERLMHEVKDACDGIAHDLRTPLAHVRGLLGQIAEQPATRNAPATRALVEQARAQSDLLLMRFKAMLRISEIGSLQRRGGFAEVDLQSLVEEVGGFYEPLAHSRSVSWTVVTEPVGVIHGDRALLFEAFSNLLDNAIKFADCGARDVVQPSGKGGEVMHAGGERTGDSAGEASAEADSHGGAVTLRLRSGLSGPVVDIVDNGPGIAAGERQAVLQPFYRSERTMHVEGSGLGLGVVMAVLRVHDFSLHISAANLGAPNAQDVSRPGARMTIECWPRTLA